MANLFPDAEEDMGLVLVVLALFLVAIFGAGLAAGWLIWG